MAFMILTATGIKCIGEKREGPYTCGKCGGPITFSFGQDPFCPNCEKKPSSFSWKAEEVCDHCHKHPPVEGSSLCEKCERVAAAAS